ncbi:MAG: small ligand-binding sensory domain FIST, partial [Mariniblastus sp.]
ETALSVWAASLPTAEIIPMHLDFVRAAGESAIVGWPDELLGEWPRDSSMLMLGEPFGFPVDVMLERFNEDRPGIQIAGGMASGAQMPGQARLLLNGETFSEGAVAVRISGAPVRTIVSQGCRPIGEPMVITKSERNIIEQLGGKLALDVVYELFQTLPTREQTMFQSGLFVGRVINEYQEKFEYGDFLIRNVVGLDKELRSITIGDFVRPGQTVQFHIRDAESASVELSQMLVKAVEQRPYASALLFTCNGRGLNMFSDPHHDANLVFTNGKDRQAPTAGFFAAGEIGNVGGKNFLHGFTASVLLFE